MKGKKRGKGFVNTHTSCCTNPHLGSSLPCPFLCATISLFTPCNPYDYDNEDPYPHSFYGDQLNPEDESEWVHHISACTSRERNKCGVCIATIVMRVCLSVTCFSSVDYLASYVMLAPLLCCHVVVLFV